MAASFGRQKRGEMSWPPMGVVKLFSLVATVGATTWDASDCQTGNAPAAYVSGGCDAGNGNAVCQVVRVGEGPPYVTSVVCYTDANGGTSDADISVTTSYFERYTIWGEDSYDQSKFSCCVNGTEGISRIDLNGGDGDDNVTAHTELEGFTPWNLNIYLFGGDGGDIMTSNSVDVGNSFVSGDADDDIIYLSVGSGVDAGAGDDEIYGSSAADTITCGSGADWVDADGGNDTVHGNAGADAIFGGSGVDNLYGDDGIDAVCGGPGNDTISGGNQDDDVWGGHGRGQRQRQHIR
ncbi:MAG: calcium-binding protein [Proteobacteria bacterium]|nr:calcium-binding protein [Pseudomonadota bacterium]